MEHKTAKENMATMNKKEKIKYIWCYFKIHIIIGLILIIGLSSFIYGKVTAKKIYCSIDYIGDYMKDNSIESIKDPLNKALVKDPKYTINLTCDYLDADTTTTKSSAQEKIIAEVAAKELDIAIVDKRFFELNLNQDMFLDLNSLEGFSALDLSKYTVAKAAQSDGKTCTYGIYVKGMNVLDKVSFNDDSENILVVIANAQHKQAAMETIKYLTGNK